MGAALLPHSEQMGKKRAGLQWTEKSILAAQLIAEDALPDVRIAEQVGVAMSTLSRWKAEPAFQTRVAAIREETRQKLIKAGIAAKQNRIDQLVERHRKMVEVIGQRAEHPDYNARRPDGTPVVPGGDTGLLVRKETPTKQGRIVEYQVDTALLAEMRATEKQVAQELGEWAEKREVSGPGGGPLQIEESPREELAQRIEAIAQRLGLTSDG